MNKGDHGPVTRRQARATEQAVSSTKRRAVSLKAAVFEMVYNKIIILTFKTDAVIEDGD